MKLSAPIHQLKRKAKLRSRAERIPLHQALNLTAAEEGFARWSLLVSKVAAAAPIAELFERLDLGDLVVVGARPGQGKTLLCLRLAMEAMRSGRRGFFFTVECTKDHLADRFRALGSDWADFDASFELHEADAICADQIMDRLRAAPRGALAVVDYLQALDQKRNSPELSAQVRALKEFARERKLIILFNSQIHRSYDSSTKPFPDLEDMRLPNPLDLTLFDSACFMNRGEVRYRSLR